MSCAKERGDIAATVGYCGPNGCDAVTAGDWAIGQVADRSGVSVSALHFYESIGLISSRRTSGNQRRFHRSVLRRLAVIQAAKRVGVPLSSISRVFANLPRDGVPSQEDWQRLSGEWQQEIKTRIDGLMALRDRLGGCIGCGCLSLDECGFVNPHDESGQRGAGAQGLEIWTHAGSETAVSQVDLKCC